MFYHELPLYHIIPLLITDKFEDRLHKQVRKYKYGTPEWVYFRGEILDTMVGSSQKTKSFNWTAAKERTEKHLALYKEKIPSPKTVTDYEKWVLGFYNQKSIKLNKLLAKSQ